ncbi:hypothetical protein HZB07_00700 [Candidatus Saganbacteria bacterium]|nr:hypothetical protein [Candidatus Saganbacteria bacterium]
MELLGLLDTLEALILDGSKIPLTKKVIVNEDKILGIIDKMRLVIQGGGGFAKDALGKQQPAGGREEARTVEKATMLPVNDELLVGRSQDEAKAVEILQQAYQMAKEIREGADKYADEVLANLEATSTRILRTVQAGRQRLQKPALAGETK